MTKIRNSNRLSSTGSDPTTSEGALGHELSVERLVADQMFWSLNIGICDLFVFWCLKFGI